MNIASGKGDVKSLTYGANKLSCVLRWRQLQNNSFATDTK